MKEGASLLSAILVSLLATGAAAWAQGSTSQTGPAGDHEGCPDEPAWTGKYHNYNYGFSIPIPESLKGFPNGSRCVDSADERVCIEDHGRTTPLTAEPHDPSRLIEVYRGYADEPDVAPVVSFELDSIGTQKTVGFYAGRPKGPAGGRPLLRCKIETPAEGRVGRP